MMVSTDAVRAENQEGAGEHKTEDNSYSIQFLESSKADHRGLINALSLEIAQESWENDQDWDEENGESQTPYAPC